MFENIKHSFEKSIKKARWLDDYTRRTALKKIKNMTAYIGFPDSMVDLETVEKEYGKVLCLYLQINYLNYRINTLGMWKIDNFFYRL